MVADLWNYEDIPNASKMLQSVKVLSVWCLGVDWWEWGPDMSLKPDTWEVWTKYWPLIGVEKKPGCGWLNVMSMLIGFPEIVL